MRMGMLAAVVMVLGSAASARAQSNATLDTPYQVRAVAKLKKGDLLTLTNTGANGALSPLCGHVYAFDPVGQLLACCSCTVGANALRSLTVGADVFEGAKPPKAGSFVVFGSAQVGGDCNPGAVGALAVGLLASKGDFPFTPSTLSAGEFSRLQGGCAALHPAGNLCPVCRDQSPVH